MGQLHLYYCTLTIAIVFFTADTVWIGAPYTRAPRIVSECETVSLAIGSALADNYNSFDEETEWDVRVHNDFFAHALGFSNIVTEGLWKSGGKTPHGAHAPKLHAVGI